LESSPGTGSCFFFDLTLQAEVGEPMQWKEITDIHKALIVDDNDNNRLILRQMLKLKNIEVEEAANGFEALQLLAKQNKYDVILMDYHMPYMDGLETIRKIRESFTASPEHLPLILLHSSSDDEKIQHACESLSINQRLVKPVKMEDLFDSLYRLNKLQVAEDKNAKLQNEPFKINSPALSILVVEDNMVNKLLAKTIINRIAPDAQILEADNGEEALMLYEKADLVLMDIQMPVMNGYEATKAIRARETDRHVPIIALTAGNVKGEKEKCLAAGMDDFVTKPFVEESIVHLFKVWLTPLIQAGDPESTKAESMVDERFDIEIIKKFVGDDEEIIKEVLVVTRQELQGSLEMIRLHANLMDIPGLNLAGHKLYGTAVSAGMNAVAAIAKQLEQLEADAASNIPQLLKKLEGEIVMVQRLINRHLPEGSN
jgi:CheY-like chemotaxis protein